MKALRNYFLATLVLVLCPAVLAWQGNTPESALEELVTAEKVEVAVRHLPVSIEQAISKLNANQKKALSDKLLVRSLLKSDGVTFNKSDDGAGWEIKNEKGQVEGVIKLKNSFVSGTEALLSLEFIQHRESDENKDSQSTSEPPPPIESENQQLVLVSMKLEGNEWRVIGFGPWRQKNIQASDFFKEELNQQEANAAVALSTLRVMNTSLVTYSTTYPKVSLPYRLEQLTGTPDEEPSAEHAMLLDPAFNASPLIKDGYEFRYTLVDAGQINPATGNREGGHYQITATPVEFGKTGSKSFFTDETAVIRVTIENREATENDEPL
jgi:hypothetical protein